MSAFSARELRRHAASARRLLDAAAANSLVPPTSTLNAKELKNMKLNAALSSGQKITPGEKSTAQVSQLIEPFPKSVKSPLRRRQPHPPFWFTEYEHVRLAQAMRNVVPVVPAQLRLKGEKTGDFAGDAAQNAENVTHAKKTLRQHLRDREHRHAKNPRSPIAAVIMGRGEPHELIFIDSSAFESAARRLFNRGDVLEGSLLSVWVGFDMEKARKQQQAEVRALEESVAAAGDGNSDALEEEKDEYEQEGVRKLLVTVHRVLRDPRTHLPEHIELYREVPGDVRGAPHLRDEFGNPKVPV